jgi:hypothetical protein
MVERLLLPLNRVDHDACYKLLRASQPVLSKLKRKRKKHKIVWEDVHLRIKSSKRPGL